jgi:tripartite-type tricarboxylate transporter receptor subunit TctC
VKLSRRQFLGIAAGTAALAIPPGVVSAQNYPSRPITMVNPFPAGGPLDSLARMLAAHMQGPLGQSVVIENVTGASGTIGTGRVARAAPDGYTFGLGYWGTHVANAAIYDLKYDVLNDFEPVVLLSGGPLLLVSKKSVPANDLASLLSWLKANPCKTTQGTAGIGTATHILGLFFMKETGTCFQSIPYRGVAPAMQDLLAEQFDLMFTDTDVSLPHVRAGSIKAFAVSAEERLATASDIPTMGESGFPSLNFWQWYGLWAPKGTPRDVIARINAAVNDALDDPTIRRRLLDQGMEVPSRQQRTPEALGELQKSEINKWWPIIKAANIRIE